MGIVPSHNAALAPAAPTLPGLSYSGCSAETAVIENEPVGDEIDALPVTPSKTRGLELEAGQRIV